MLNRLFDTVAEAASLFPSTKDSQRCRSEIYLVFPYTYKQECALALVSGRTKAGSSGVFAEERAEYNVPNNWPAR